MTYTHSVCLGAQSCLTLCDPLGCSPPGSPVHGIFQARILDWRPYTLLSKIDNNKVLLVSQKEFYSIPCSDLYWKRS